MINRVESYDDDFMFPGEITTKNNIEFAKKWIDSVAKYFVYQDRGEYKKLVIHCKLNGDKTIFWFLFDAPIESQKGNVSFPISTKMESSQFQEQVKKAWRIFRYEM